MVDFPPCVGPGFHGSAIHLRGADGLPWRERPIGVEGGHRFLPPSTPTCPADAYRQVEAHRWIAELLDNGAP